MGVFSMEQFMQDQKLALLKPVARADLTGKVIIVTGANTGLGYDTAKHFAGMNPLKVVLACRNESKGKAAVERLKSETGFQRAELQLVDFGSFASIKSFADKFNNEADRLDILVENAAMAGRDYIPSNDGWQIGFQVNSLGPQLLALLLLPKMVETSKIHNTIPRIVVLSSDVHYWITIDDKIVKSDNIHATITSEDYHNKNFILRADTSAYTMHKLLNVLFVRELQARLSDSPIVVTAINPGLCMTELRRDATEEQKKVFTPMEAAMGITAEEGARTVIFGAVGFEDDKDKLKTLRGAYMSTLEVKEPSDWILSPIGMEAQVKIWTEMVDILSNVDARIPKIVAEYLG